MIQDRGSRYLLGYGVVQPGPTEQTNPSPDAGFIAKALERHPIERFLAVSAATMIGMHVAGKLIQGGGIKLAATIDEHRLERGFQHMASSVLGAKAVRAGGVVSGVDRWATQGLQDIRKIRSQIEDWEQYTVFSGLKADQRNFEFGNLEKQVAHEWNRSPDPDRLWTLRKEITNKMIQQAKRLPYELPAAYATQRLLVDPMTGQKSDTKWYSPTDVISDFTKQSLSNLAFMITPWELGSASVKHGYKSFRTMGLPVAEGGTVGIGNEMSRGVQTILQNFGQDAAQILGHTARRTTQFSSAFSVGISEALHSQQPIRTSASRFRDVYSSQTRHYQGFWQKIQGAVQAGQQAHSLDVKIPPFFGGMQTFVSTFSKEWKALNTAQGDIYKGASPALRSRLGGFSDIEQIAQSINNLVGGPGDAPNAKGVLASGYLRGRYRGLLAEELSNIDGVSPQAAEHVANLFTINSLPSSSRRQGAQNLWFNRIGLGGQFASSTQEELERNLLTPLSKMHGSGPQAVAIAREEARNIAQNVRTGVRATDARYLKGLSGFKRQIQTDWRQLYHGEVLDYVERGRKAKIPFNALSNLPEVIDQGGHDFILREVGARAGYRDAKTVSLDVLRGRLDARGINTSDPRSIRAFLVSKGAMSKPWHRDGFGTLGLRPLTLDRALDPDIQFYQDLDHTPLGQRIGSIGRDLTKQSGAFGRLRQVKVGGVYEMAGGGIVDLSAFKSFGRRAADLLADNFQIPLIHIKPLNTLFYGAFRSLSSPPGIRFGEKGAGAFLDSAQQSSEGFLGFSHGRKSYAINLKPGLESMERYEKIPNVRFAPTDTSSLVGRQVREAIGDRGIGFTKPEQGRFKRFFGFDRDQPQSIFQWAGRIKGARAGEDWDNPATLANLLVKDPGFVDKLDTPAKKMKFARGFAKLEQDLRLRGVISTEVEEMLENIKTGNPGNSFKEMLSTKIGQPIWSRDANNIPTFARPGAGTGNVSLSQVGQYHRSLVAFARSLIDDPAVMQSVGDNRELRSQLMAAQRRLNFLLSDKIDLQGIAPTAARKVGVSRRIDELRQEIVRYSLTKQRLLNGEVASGLTPVQTLLSDVEGLRQAGKLSKKQYTELRSAALSIDINTIRALESGGVGTPIEKTISVARTMMKRPESSEILGEVARYENKYPTNPLMQLLARQFGHAQYTPDLTYNPFGGNTENVLLPTTGGALRRHPVQAAMSLLGINNYSAPKAFSAGSILSGHVWGRLDRYFSTFGLGLDPTAYKGSLDFYARGIVGKRILPAVVAGSALFTADATLGGMVHRRDNQGKRVYSPLVLGGVAKGIAAAQVGLAGVLPGGQTRAQKHEEIYEGEVPVRKGRWWTLGNTPFKGGRVSYYQPSWYRRFTSGAQFTGQNWSSPLEKFAFGEDFSPLKYLDPYHYERKHYRDRPYPVSGELFTGPWGPLTGALNSTFGRVFKPPIRMHKKEVAEGLAQYNAVGIFGATIPKPQFAGLPLYTNNRGRMQVGTPAATGDILSTSSAGAGAVVPGSGGRLDAVLGAGGTHGLGLDVISAPFNYRTGTAAGQLSNVYGATTVVPAGGYSQSGAMSRDRLAAINQQYVDASKAQLPLSRAGALSTPYTMSSRQNMLGDVIPNLKPITATKLGVTLSQTGYETQEMAGIYGFVFGSLREGLGLGKQDLSPRKPVLVAASRAYGAERGFWDRNLGGLGDVPSPFEGEYANLEVSEIVRRFIPHRRRDIIELNPIPNQMGKQYPWLPGADYFQNFQQGDPYAGIPLGEMRMPGAAYERLNKLHPDETGKYGLVDQFKILGDIAPYSDEYRALSRVVSKLDLSSEEQKLVTTTRAHVAERNKPYEFAPYKYAHQDFATGDFTIEGRVPGTADQFFTKEMGPNRTLRLAGVRARSQAAQDYMDQMIQPGAKVQAKYDINAPYASTLDAIITSGGKNVNQTLMGTGMGNISQVNQPIDVLEKSRSPVARILGAGLERLAHLNTGINTKFGGKRTATEDWERRYVYSPTFTQWQHPIRDYLKPLIAKSEFRNPITSTVVMAGVGRMMFAGTPQGKAVGAVAGGTIGLAGSLVGEFRRHVLKTPMIPAYRRKELAIEENVDILNYVKYSALYAKARGEAIAAGEPDPEGTAAKANQEKRKDISVSLGGYGAQALQYRKQIQQTLYGADLYGDILDLTQAEPKRRRPYFQQLLNAPKNERERILRTSPRLERRIFEARWGMKVEKRPDLTEYFQHHELPGPQWEGWDPGVNMNMVKLKIIQSQGLDASMLGYYPQEVQPANLVNPSYPEFNQQSKKAQVISQLRTMFGQQGGQGQVIAQPNYTGGDRLQMDIGIAS